VAWYRRGANLIGATGARKEVVSISRPIYYIRGGIIHGWVPLILFLNVSRAELLNSLIRKKSYTRKIDKKRNKK
jgi:hypothetical protein